MRRFSTRDLTLAAVIAAAYTVLTLTLSFSGYMGVQLRVAEALTVLPFLFPAAIPGLTVGCFLANLLGSPMAADWICGTAATLLAALWTSRVKNKWLAPLPPVLCNAVIVGAQIAWFFPEGLSFWPAYALNALTVGIGELVACYGFGMLLLEFLLKVPYFRPMLADRHLS